MINADLKDAVERLHSEGDRYSDVRIISNSMLAAGFAVMAVALNSGLVAIAEAVRETRSGGE